MRTNTSKQTVLGIVLGMLLVGQSTATTLNSVSVDQLATDAELIFEGEVIAHETRRDPAADLIYTFVTFAVHDVIKGTLAGSQLELRFAGGSAGNDIVEISGLTLPDQGEQGIYFIESVSRNLLNPILGWSQGHYLILEENGQRIVSTLNREAITAVQPVASIPSTIRRAQRLVEGESDAADGIVSVPRGATTEEAMTVERFKDSIRSLLP